MDSQQHTVTAFHSDGNSVMTLEAETPSPVGLGRLVFPSPCGCQRGKSRDRLRGPVDLPSPERPGEEREGATLAAGTYLE